MASVGTFNKNITGTGVVQRTSLIFTNNIENFVGSAANADGRIDATDLIDFDIDGEEVITPEKFANAVGSIIVSGAISLLSAIGNFFVDVASTAAVVATSITSGVLKLGEKVLDGVVWVGATAGSAMGFDTTGMKEFIARDLTAEANEAFYENTDLGRFINENSALKYDSEFAQGIQNVTEKAAEIAAATALTVVTGGAAAPFVVGTVVGLGAAAESTYQTHGTDTTVLQELGIAGSGLLTGMAWVANGKLGQGALNIGKDIAKEGAAKVGKTIAKQVFNKDFITTQLKKSLSLRTVTQNGKKVLNIGAIMNYTQSAMSTGQSLVKYITGEKEFDGTEAIKLAGTYLGFLLLNVAEDVGRDYITNYQSIGEFVARTPIPSTVDDTTATLDLGLKGLAYDEWRGRVTSAPYQADIDGIRFTSDTEEGLRRLEEYYNSVKASSNPEALEYIRRLSESHLTLTDIGDQKTTASFHWMGIVCFNDKTLTSGNTGTFFHETGHFVDFMTAERARQIAATAVDNISPEEAEKLVSHFYHDSYKYAAAEASQYTSAYIQTIREIARERCALEIENWNELSSDLQEAVLGDMATRIQNAIYSRNIDSLGALSDILDAFTSGEVSDKYRMPGHGGNYFNNSNSKGAEVIAEFVQLLLNGDEDLLREYLPEDFVNQMIDVVNQMVGA